MEFSPANIIISPSKNPSVECSNNMNEKQAITDKHTMRYATILGHILGHFMVLFCIISMILYTDLYIFRKTDAGVETKEGCILQ